MGAFLLTLGPGSRSAAAEQVLERQGFSRPQVLSTDAFELVVHPRHVDPAASMVTFPNGDFAASVGTLVLEGRRDREALGLAYERFRGDIGSLDDALGCFGLLVYRDGVLHVASDPVGSYQIYRDTRTGAVSSSFLALAAAAQRLTLSRQSVYEYVFNGIVTGDDGLVREIQRLPLRATYEVVGGRGRVRPTALEVPRSDPRPREEQLADAEALLGAGIRDVAAAFEGNVALGLTGGYDSRLLLALVRRHGLTPRVLVYRGGGVKARTVQLAHEVAAADGVPVEVIDRDARPMPSPDEMPAAVERNLLDADGWIYHGLFVLPVDREYRAQSAPRGTVYLHGAAGELYRNAWLMPDGRHSAMDMVRVMYSKVDPRMCSALFDRRRYAAAVAEKMRSLGGLPEGKLDRQVFEWLFAAFRVRDFSGREITLSNWSGAAMTPFFEYRVLRHAWRIPIRYKVDGTFEAELIRRASPRLAAVRSQYGHDFTAEPPLRYRARAAAFRQLPIRARPRLYAWQLRARARRGTRAWLSEANVRAVLPDGVVRVAGLFDLDAPLEYLVKARILSVEVLARHLDGKLDTEWGG